MKRTISGMLRIGRRGGAGVLIVVLTLGLLGQPAHALQAPVSFTAVDLPTYQTNGVAWTVAEANGLVFVGGSFSAIRPGGAAGGTSETPRLNFAVFDAATGAPTSCAPSFALPSNPGGATVRALNVSPDKRTLYVGGYFSQAGGVARSSIAALDIASCTVLSSFAIQPNATVRAIQSTPTVVYFGGDITRVNGQPRSYLAAARAVGNASSGALLPWAPVLTANLRALALKPDGTALVLGGDFTQVNGSSTRGLAVVNPETGVLIRRFSRTIPYNSVVKDLTVDSTGFYVGAEGTGWGAFDGRLAINWSDWSQRWRDDCLGATQALVVFKSVLYSGSHAHDCSAEGEFPNGARHHLLAESVDGPAKLAWFPQTNGGIGEALGPRDMATSSSAAGDFLWVVGEFTTVNGRAQQGLTRFGTTVDAAPSAPAPTLSSPSSGTARVTWPASLDNDNIRLTYYVYRDGSATPVSTQQADSTFWSRPTLTFTDPGLVPGSTHTYRVAVFDGRTTVSSATQTITVR